MLVSILVNQNINQFQFSKPNLESKWKCFPLSFDFGFGQMGGFL